MTTYRLGEIQPNPFRDFTRNPIIPEKVEALKRSIYETGFWQNVEARIGPDGLPELAYGHHRVHAAIEVFGPDHHVPLNIIEADDALIIRRMAWENDPAWRAPATAEMDAVSAVIRAFADDRIALEPPSKNATNSGLRCAPSFQRGYAPTASCEHTYTAETVAAWLGWEPEKVRRTLQALELSERGILPPDIYQDLGPAQAYVVTKAARAAEAEDLLEWADDLPAEADTFVRMAREVVSGLAVPIAEGFRNRTLSVADAEKMIARRKSSKTTIDLPRYTRQAVGTGIGPAAQAVADDVSIFIEEHFRHAMLIESFVPIIRKLGKEQRRDVRKAVARLDEVRKLLHTELHKYI